MEARSSDLGVGKRPVRSFEDLNVWQESQQLAVEVYRVSKTFPKDEIFGLTSQLRRAVASVSANIAEGFGRSTVKDKLNFLSIAYGSLLETKNFIYLAEKLGYLDKSTTSVILEKITICQKLLNGFRRSLQS